MSVIHYKFKSSKDYDTYKFDGAGVPVWELKNEIIQAKKLVSKSNDFDLIISNAQTEQDYVDESHIIPRNSSVLVRRVPVVRGRPTMGKGYNSMSGGGAAAMNGSASASYPNKSSVTAQVRPPFQQSASTSSTSFNAATSSSQAYRPPPFPNNHMASSAALYNAQQPSASLTPAARAAGPAADEDSKIQAMMTESSSHWSKNQNMPSQAQYSQQRRMARPRPANSVPPPNYLCYRCGQKGHFIAYCPTNQDPSFDRPRMKKTTGIPKSFLKPVETTDLSGGGGVLLTMDGGLVVAPPNDREWGRLAARTKTDLDLSKVPAAFKCRLCEQILTDPVSMPCCHISYCDDCIRQYLLDDTEQRLKCANCKHAIIPDQLVTDRDLQRRILEFLGAPTKSPISPSKTNLAGNEKATGAGHAAGDKGRMHNADQKDTASKGPPVTDSRSQSSSSMPATSHYQPYHNTAGLPSHAQEWFMDPSSMPPLPPPFFIPGMVRPPHQYPDMGLYGQQDHHRHMMMMPRPHHPPSRQPAPFPAMPPPHFYQPQQPPMSSSSHGTFASEKRRHEQDAHDDEARHHNSNGKRHHYSRDDGYADDQGRNHGEHQEEDGQEYDKEQEP